jgi:hypothetical protein
MKRYTDDLQLEFKDYNELSVCDYLSLNLKVYHNDKFIGETLIYEDIENDSKEYIIINNEIIYIEDLKKHVD